MNILSILKILVNWNLVGQERTRDEIIAMINEQIGRYVADKIVTSDEFNSQVAAVNERESDPYTVVNGVMTSVLK